MTHILLDALLLPPSDAENAWRKWRASVDLDRIDPESFNRLPTLAARLPEWTTDDPQQGILLGICRRAWSQNQIRRKARAEAIAILNAAGIDRVSATGPVLWGELYWPEGAIRPIEAADLLIEPANVHAALDALTRAGWNAPDGLPPIRGNDFYFGYRVAMRNADGGDGSEIRVHWRSLPHTDFALRRPPVPLFAPIPVEHSLVAALGGDMEDRLGWKCDALFLCRQPGLNWNLIAELLRWRSKARNRLEQLRSERLVKIPAEATRPPRTAPLERILSSALRAYRRVC
jgi:hypothetical protein